MFLRNPLLRKPTLSCVQHPIRAQRSSWSWRFVSVTATLLLLGCGKLGLNDQPEPLLAPTIAQVANEPPLTALVTVTVAISPSQLFVGDVVTATVHIQNQARDCSYSMYDLTLLQTPSEPPLLEYLSPQRLGPPAPTNAAFRLRALRAGEVSLTGSLYGEDFCNGAFTWAYRTGSSGVVTIKPSAIQPALFLPLVYR